MSTWRGKVTPNSINLVRVGGGNLLPLLVPVAVAGAATAFAIAFAVQIEIVMTVLTVIAVLAVFARPTYVLLCDITWPWEARRVRAFSAEVDRAFAAQALEPVAPLRVTAERVHELDAPAPVIDLHINRDALEA